jgi:hypothetical protein
MWELSDNFHETGVVLLAVLGDFIEEAINVFTG